MTTMRMQLHRRSGRRPQCCAPEQTLLAGRAHFEYGRREPVPGVAPPIA